jgi:hypothetical protein
MLAGGYTLLGNLMVARAVSLHGTASSRPTPIALWVHVTLVLNILACILTLACLLSQTKVRHRP